MTTVNNREKVESKIFVQNLTKIKNFKGIVYDFKTHKSFQDVKS